MSAPTRSRRSRKRPLDPTAAKALTAVGRVLAARKAADKEVVAALRVAHEDAGISYRQMEEGLRERGYEIDHSTIARLLGATR